MRQINFQCIEVLGPGHLTPETLNHLGQIIHDKLEEHSERQKERHGMAEDF